MRLTKYYKKKQESVKKTQSFFRKFMKCLFFPGRSPALEAGFPVYRQHQAVNELFNADLSSVFALSADVIHLRADLLEGEQCAGIDCKRLVHEVLDAHVGQICHAYGNGAAHSLLHVLGRGAQNLAQLADADLGDWLMVGVEILADFDDIVAALLSRHADPV